MSLALRTYEHQAPQVPRTLWILSPRLHGSNHGTTNGPDNGGPHSVTSTAVPTRAVDHRGGIDDYYS